MLTLSVIAAPDVKRNSREDCKSNLVVLSTATGRCAIRTDPNMCENPCSDLGLDGHRCCASDVTDDAMMVERLGYPVKMFLGAYENLKVTTPDDMAVVETLLEEFRP